MATIYGNRYSNLGSIAGGGQGDIFRVRDTLDPAKTEYALKRLRNVERCARFKLEIEALQKIDHPNVMKIIDHSGDPVSGTDHKYWFVMPIAEGGNLEKRIGLYKGDLDAVLKVAIQLADALIAAHSAGITHRDLKPANILFPRLDHHVWLSDFGICHSATLKDRLTPADEIVGASGFIAPELEVGGPLPVSGAADIYSLGKVIYYMLSGGQTVAREQLDSPSYVAAFAKGERFGLLRTLLSRMIVPLERRIATATETRRELQYIEEWDRHAHAMALGPGALAAIEAAKRGNEEQQRIKTHNAEVRAERERLVLGVAENYVTWLRAELEKTSALLTQGGTFQTSIEAAMWKGTQNFVVQMGRPGDGAFVSIGGLEFSFINSVTTMNHKYVLKFFLTELRQFDAYSGNKEPLLKRVEPELAVIPYLAQHVYPDYNRWGISGFLKAGAVMVRGPAWQGQSLLSRSFIGPPHTLIARFKASEWASASDVLKAVYSEAIETAIKFSESDAQSADP